VEQMKRDAGATEFKPDRGHQPQNIITKTVEQATQIERGLNNEALEQPPRIALYRNPYLTN